jgi:hypothetical protein
LGAKDLLLANVFSLQRVGFFTCLGDFLSP